MVPLFYPHYLSCLQYTAYIENVKWSNKMPYYSKYVCMEKRVQFTVHAWIWNDLIMDENISTHFTHTQEKTRCYFYFLGAFHIARKYRVYMWRVMMIFFWFKKIGFPLQKNAFQLFRWNNILLRVHSPAAYVYAFKKPNFI